MNKTYQELCEELQMLRDTLEQMEAEEGQEITDLRQRLQASQQNEENLMIRVRYLEARLVKAGETSRVQRSLEAQLQGEINELEGKVIQLRTERDGLAAHVERLREAFKKGYQQDFTWTWVKEVLDEAPITSHARLKAQWQAEALQELYNTWKGEGTMRVGALLDKAIELQDAAEDGCSACASRPGQYHAPECPAVNAFTAGRIPAGGAE